MNLGNLKGLTMDILQGFKKWDRKSAPKTTEPMVTMQRRGIFSLNRAAFEAMGEPKKVDLYFNERENIVAFVPAEEDSLSAYPPREQGNRANYYGAGQLFTRHNRIDSSVARRYRPTIKDYILFLDLKGPSMDATGARARQKVKNESKD